MEANVPHISWDSIQQESLIGSGGFGDVFKGTWLGTPVAIKQLHLKKLTHDLEESFLQEAKIMAKCNFPNVVRLFAVCLDPGQYAMIMEYMSRGSLYDVLQNKDEPISWKLRMQISVDIGNGLAYLHANKIVHRDLKSLNVLLDDNYRAKITDFGLAKVKLETTAATVASPGAGTTRWKAPELFSRQGSPTSASDVYSYGMLLWEIASRKLPFADAPDEVTAGIWIKDGETEHIPADCPVLYGQVIKECWKKEPSHRPSAAQVVKNLMDVQTDIEIATIKSWHFNPLALKKPEATQNNNNQNSTYMLLPASQADIDKVLYHYHHHPVSKMDIKSVKIIHNPTLSRAFELRLGLLQQRDGKAAFGPKWKTTQNETTQQRQQIIETMEKIAAPYKDPDFPAVKILPMWHGTRSDVLPVLFETGYVNLATTDSGFFGKGIYSTYEAEYAYRVYSKGSLVLNWVSTFSAYPTIDGDMSKLQSKGNFENYDSHFVPVIPPDGQISHTSSVYHPCKPGQAHQYIEMVVFDSQQCLPRYLVELQPNLPLEPSSETSNENQTDRRRSRPRSTAFYKPRAWESSETQSNATLVSQMQPLQVSQQPKQPQPQSQLQPQPQQQQQVPYQQHQIPQYPTSNSPTSSTPYATPDPGTTPTGEDLYREALKFFEDCRFKQALPILEKAAFSKWPPAYIRLAQIHSTSGLVGPKDHRRAEWYEDQVALNFNWFIQEAHRTKRPDAINDAGCCFYYGYGTPQDLYTAFSWFRRAAEGGHTWSMFQLGACLYYGEGVLANINEAIIWYAKAAERGHALAQVNLGNIYRYDVNDPKAAFAYFTKGTEKELGAAYANLGLMYCDGYGVPQDDTQAVALMTKAAELGVVLAQVTLGELYENGHGQYRDVQRAAFWYKQAMLQGEDDAADNYHRLKTLHPWITV